VPKLCQQVPLNTFWFFLSYKHTPHDKLPWPFYLDYVLRKKIKKYLIVPFFTTDTFCHHFLKALTDALIVVSIFMTMNTSDIHVLNKYWNKF